MTVAQFYLTHPLSSPPFSLNLDFPPVGNSVSEFATFSDSCFTQLRILLGDFSYAKIESSHRILGPIYFFLYIFVMFFILLNVFLAIITDSYADVKLSQSGTANHAGELKASKVFGSRSKKIHHAVSVIPLESTSNDHRYRHTQSNNERTTTREQHQQQCNNKSSNNGQRQQ